MFPHLVNCGKYGMTIMAAVTLSLFRIDGTNTYLALFATFSVVNSIYCSIWDLLMDFSLLQPDSRHRLLRDILSVKHRWVYYVIMVIDPILRFAWIFYAIFTFDKQHSTIVSFMIGFAEVTRRGMWALLRVENEHCANVAQYKASRDTPLPYKIGLEPLAEESGEETVTSQIDQEEGATTAVDVGSGRLGARRGDEATDASPAVPGAEESGLRKRRKSDALRSGGETIRRIMAQAHKQDFEKKRKPSVSPGADSQAIADDTPSDEEDDDDDDSASVLGERLELRHRANTLVGDSDSEGED